MDDSSNQDDVESGRRVRTDGGETAEAEGEEQAEEEEEAEGEAEPDTTDSPEREDDKTGVLYLDIGDGLFLDLLGLEVDLEEVELDVRGAEGEGKLVGNLLGAVSGLLDKPDIVGTIKDALGGLVPGGEGEEGGLGQRIGGGAKSMLGNIPLDQILNRLVSELIDQLMPGEEPTEESEEPSEASAEGEEAAA